MIDMTILIVGLIAVIALAVVFFGMTDRGGDGSSPLMSGLSTVKKFFDKTKRKPNVKAAVIYINIFYENLQTMIERRDLTNIREQVENEVLQLCRYGRGEEVSG